MLTINNPDLTLEETMTHAMQICVYSCGQKEISATGTTHFQIFLYTQTKSRCKTISKHFPTAHVEITRDIEKSRQYCMKDDTRLEGPIELGHFPKSGQNHNAFEFIDLEADY